MEGNIAKIEKAFHILHPILTAYVAREFQREYDGDWWREVLSALPDQCGDLPKAGEYGELVDSIDIANALRLFDRRWNELFRKKLSLDYRTWAKELMGVRNKVAHFGGKDFNDDDTWRALDTMARLCDAFDDDSAEEIRKLMRKTRYGTDGGSTGVTEAAAASAGSGSHRRDSVLSDDRLGLPSWRNIIEPHPDVAQGRYKSAEFAADLGQVARGEGAFEYRDPVEFFARTYVTEGMTELLFQALKRVSGRDGEPVIQLKTAFGGGKTHSMLALYHMMRGKVPADRLPNLKPVLERAGVSELPRANVAVLVGTALDPTKSRRPANFPGITINTLWGEIAAQLAESTGRSEVYDYVKEADKKGVSPGSETLKKLFDDCAPCLVLMDELVAYGRKIYDVKGLPAGSFDNFITFVQELSEAARASRNSLVVASIPESDIEIGGDAGKTVLATIEHTFGRMEAIWKPVAAHESFEVVRRRLFLDCKNPAARDEVCNRFSDMYCNNAEDFPHEAKEVEYRERMRACYPIHPEIFDRLYEDWSTIEKFQRTRGVLRLMAAVIHALWMANDGGAMIMPGSIPLDVPNVRDELSRNLPETWNSVITQEVDGKSSVPYQEDKRVQRFGSKLAARRVARTIMLGSAPMVRTQSVRGIEAARIRLGVVQPGESIADFNDALSTLRGRLMYLYTDNKERFWYDTRPTLRKTVQDRMTQQKDADVEYEIETRLKKLRREPPFAGLHVCPVSSLDVPDEQAVRLVILPPNKGGTYKPDDPGSAALLAASDILDKRGLSPRIYRNMLVFVAPDRDKIASLRGGVKEYLAWKSIEEDTDKLNLDRPQMNEAKGNRLHSDETVEARIKETYCWLLAPYIDMEAGLRDIRWDAMGISGGDDSIVSKAANKLRQNEALITKWAPKLLLLELDKVLWKDSDSIQIKKLWEYLCSYCYLPRLSHYSVLEAAVLTGLSSGEYFAVAGGCGDGRFLNLRFDQRVDSVSPSDYLVKKTAALEQIVAEGRQAKGAGLRTEDRRFSPADGSDGAQCAGAGGGEAAGGRDGEREGVSGSPAAPEPLTNTHFYMSAQLDKTRINRDVQQLVEEVISHLTAVEGCKVDISLGVDASAPKGLPASTVRTVTENCRTLNVRQFGVD